MTVALFFIIVATGHCQPIRDAVYSRLLDSIDSEGQQAEQDQKKLSASTLPPAQKAEVERDYQAHVDKIVQIGQAQPQSQPVNLEAGKKLFELGESKQGAPFADQSVQLARQSGDAKALHESLMTQARIRFDLKDYLGVVADADELLKRDPKDQAALRLRAMAANRTGSGAGTSPAPGASASQAQANAGAVAPADAVAPRPSAEALLAKAVRISQQVDSIRLANEASGRIGLDPAAAVALLDKAVALDPNNAQAYALRSRAVLAEGASAAALEDAERAVSLDPRDAAAYEARAQAGLKLGRPAAQVLADLRAAAELDPAFGPDYEKALARIGSAAPGAGGPAESGAPAGWFVHLAEALRGNAALAVLCVTAGAVLAAWIALFLRSRRASDELQ